MIDWPMSLVLIVVFCLGAITGWVAGYVLERRLDRACDEIKFGPDHPEVD